MLAHTIFHVALALTVAFFAWSAHVSYKRRKHAENDLALLKRILRLSDVGIFKWESDDSVIWDATAQRHGGLLSASGRFSYKEWADRVAGESDLEDAQRKAAESIVSNTPYIDVIRYRNGRRVLYAGSARANGYKLAGVSIDVTALIEKHELRAAESAARAAATRSEEVEREIEQLRAIHRGIAAKLSESFMREADEENADRE